MKRDQLKSLLLGAILLAGITLPAKAQIGEQRHNFAIGINGGANYKIGRASCRERVCLYV